MILDVRLCIRYVPELGLVSVLERQERELDLRYAPIIRYVPELGLVSVLERRERELDLLLRPHYASHFHSASFHTATGAVLGRSRNKVCMCLVQYASLCS